MAVKTENARVPAQTLRLYRKWAKDTGRTLTALVDAALDYGFRNRIQVEMDMAPKQAVREDKQ